MAWYIKGEIGRTLDATLRELSALNCDSAVLEFHSLASDRLQWTAETLDATGAGTIVPDAGQMVEIWKDWVRKFRGHVLAPRVGSRSIAVSAEGPWWWMTRTPLTSDQMDSTGVTAERANYVFPTGSHKSKIEALINRAIANGVPMRLGTVAASYDTPNMSLAESNCAQALTELLAWVPDAVAWFDHTDTSGNGLPILNISRRGTMPATTYTVGVDAVIDTDISPRLDLEVSQMRLDYVVRNPTTGKPAWATQESGVAVAGKRQIVTVSGPEIADFLPRDDFESFNFQLAGTSGAGLFNFVRSSVSAIAAAPAPYSGIGIANGSYKLLTTYDFQRGWLTDSGPNSGSAQVRNASAPVFRRTSDNAVVNANNYFIVENSSQIPTFVSESPGFELFDVNITGTIIVRLLLNSNLGFSFPSPADFPPPSWYNPSNFYNIIDGGEFVSGRDKYRYAMVNFTKTAKLTNYGSGGTIYRPWDYNFITPPDGLANGLRLAQNWVPWEGPITLVGDEVSGDNLLAAKYNLAAALPACASMETLAKSVSHEIATGRTSIDLGTPARSDFGTLTSRISRQPRDNIVYL